MRSAAIAILIALAVSNAALAVDERSIARDIHLGSWDGRVGPMAVSAAEEGAETFGAIALHFATRAVRDIDPLVSVRASSDGVRWSDWRPLTIDGDSTERSEARYATGIAHFDEPMRFLQVSFDAPADRIVATLFPPNEPSAQAQMKAEGKSYRFGSVTVRARSEWGCPDGEASRWTPAYTTITHAVVHHTAGANSVADWDAEMRSIWYLHTITNGWGDIGYNYLIDPNGVVYEGRAGANGAIGAHFSCRNSGTAGVALLGTYSNVSPTPAALGSLRRVLAEIARRNGIDPTALAVRHASSGLIVPAIMGHRDGNSGYATGQTCTSTECPGNMVYAMLPQIRSDVACAPAIVADPASTAILAGSSATLTVNATGENLTYQWYRGESGATAVPVDDGTGATVSVAPSSTTPYWVRVSNSCATFDSATAIVNITGSVRLRPARP